MYLEARGKYKEAESTIGKLLEDHPNSHYAIRRQVGRPSANFAVFPSQNYFLAAVDSKKFVQNSQLVQNAFVPGSLDQKLLHGMF